jgi:hypothetical protein
MSHVELIAHRFASVIAKEETVSLTLKQAVDPNIGDLLICQPIDAHILCDLAVNVTIIDPKDLQE